MSHQIAPSILAKLHAFSRRRRKLIIIRGICAAAGDAALATMMLVALIDAHFRPAGLGALDAQRASRISAVIIVEWRASLRLLVHAPGPRRLARLVENAEPKLREDLLSAVELGDRRIRRASIRSSSARSCRAMSPQRMEGMDDGAAAAGAVWCGATSAVAAVIVRGAGRRRSSSLACNSVRSWCARSCRAQISRASRKFQVEHRSSRKSRRQAVPHGETVPLVVEISGGRTNKARAGDIHHDGGREVVPMTPSGRGSVFGDDPGRARKCAISRARR